MDLLPPLHVGHLQEFASEAAPVMTGCGSGTAAWIEGNLVVPDVKARQQPWGKMIRPY